MQKKPDFNIFWNRIEKRMDLSVTRKAEIIRIVSGKDPSSINSSNTRNIHNCLEVVRERI